MRAIRWTLAGLFLSVMVAGSVSPAGAQFDENTNACSGTGTFRNGRFSVNADTTQVITVPREDTVDWTGSVGAAPGAYKGELTIKLPAIAKLFGASRIEKIDSWSGDSQTTSNSGTEEYKLPSWVPGGAEFTVQGFHEDANGRCSGQVTLKLAGSPIKSPVTWVSLLGTAGTGAGMVWIARPLFRRVSS